jgi:flagellin-like hook-associated protein FlgL
MASGIVLTAGMRENLVALQKTNMLMETTQKRLSTGKRVNSALDDPINFFAAQSHTQRASDLSLRKDGMSEAIQTLKAADNGIAAITSLVEQAKSVITAARSVTTSTDAATLEAQYDEILSQIDFTAADSGYKGTNLINDSTGSLVVDFDENGDSKLSIAGVDASTGANGLNLSTSAEVTTSSGGTGFEDSATLDDAVAELDSAINTLRTNSASLSSNLSIVTNRQDFTTNMINTLEDGAAKLTDADLNEEGANMLMLQTRQQLGTSSLSMASQAAQSILRLF